MTNDRPTRVLLADDHTMFREGLAGLLTSYSGLEVVAEVPNDAQTLELVRELVPDVVIMQVQRPFERAKETLEEAEDGSGGLLSARELEILLLAARGLSNRRIASHLHLAEGTVKRHLANTYHKMGVRSRGEAARRALREEWITITDVTDEEEEA